MKVSIGALGGIGEIGMNMYIYETETSAVIVDCGVKFAGASDPGVDLIIPDFSYLETIKNKLKYVVISHAHEDHMGALPFLLSKYPLAVAACKFSMDIVSNKLKEWDISVEKTYLKYDEPLAIGDFNISFIPISHSIHGTGVILLEVGGVFSALHASDYKIDFSPLSGAKFMLKPFLALGESGLDCLVADSTNALSNGFTGSERQVAHGLEKIFKENSGRIFFTTFASNTERIGSVISLAEKYGRKVALEGTSLKKNIEIARQNGLLKINENTIVQRKRIEKNDDDKICVIATGSQGEPASVISKIAKNDYGNICIRNGDLFVFSSRIIPGNEQNIVTVMNNIASSGGRCIDVDMDDTIHASGHASREDMKLFLKLIKPKYLIPVHGEELHLQGHKEVALQCGITADNIILMKNGEKCCFVNNEFKEIEIIPSGKNFIDAKGSFILNSDELRERKRLSYEGAVFVYVKPDFKSGHLDSEPVASFVGFAEGAVDTHNFIGFLKSNIDNQLFERFSKEGWQVFVNKLVRKYFKRFMGRRPITSVIVGD